MILRPLRRPERNDQGFTMVATLSVVLTLGLLATIVIVASPGSPPQRDQTSTPNVATTIPKNISSGASESAISACKIDFQAVNAAVATYRALNGSSPPREPRGQRLQPTEDQSCKRGLPT